MTHPALKRQAATQATFNEWHQRPFKLGHADCARLVASHLRRFGHKVKLPPAGRYNTPRAALKELKALDVNGMVGAIDALGLDRIAPAAALAGDIIALPSDSPIGCITIALGNGRVLGWHDDVAEAEVLQPVQYEAAWRV